MDDNDLAVLRAAIAIDDEDGADLVNVNTVVERNGLDRAGVSESVRRLDEEACLQGPFGGGFYGHRTWQEHGFGVTPAAASWPRTSSAPPARTTGAESLRHW